MSQDLIRTWSGPGNLDRADRGKESPLDPILILDAMQAASSGFHCRMVDVDVKNSAVFDVDGTNVKTASQNKQSAACHCGPWGPGPIESMVALWNRFFSHWHSADRTGSSARDGVAMLQPRPEYKGRGVISMR